MEIVDSHVHFWNPAALRYVWLDDLPALNHPFLPADYHADAAPHAVSGIVFVQADCEAGQGISEARWVASLAHQAPVQGIVAFAPLDQGDAARATLDELRGIPLVKGVRRLIQSEALGFARQPRFIEGVQALAAYGFSFDLCIYHHQLDDVIALVDQCPAVSFVLDHIGKPAIASGAIDAWRRGITALAARDHVYCKLSGLVTEADAATWTQDDLAPYVDHVLDAFGTSRIMFGSDYPVVRLASSLTRWIDTAAGLLSRLSAADQRAIFFENARRFYRLENEQQSEAV